MATNNLLTGRLLANWPISSSSPAGPEHNSLLGMAPSCQWAYVRPRFEQFLENLCLTANQVTDGQTKISGVASSLNRAYWGAPDGSANITQIGSWAKHTRVRPPRDIDLHFILPVSVYYRFEQRHGNKQSQLLQEIRDILCETYPLTDVAGDRHVVVVPFDTYKVEVAPAFHREGGGFLVCDTSGIGRYKHVDPGAELAAFSAADTQYNGNVRKLTRIFKQWQRECNVPIKSFHLEAVVKGALSRVTYSGENEFWFDWLVRDTLAHLISCKNGWFSMAVTGEIVSLGDEWLSRAEAAYARAVKACDFERANENYAAGVEWQKIFGAEIPVLA